MDKLIEKMIVPLIEGKNKEKKRIRMCGRGTPTSKRHQYNLKTKPNMGS